MAQPFKITLSQIQLSIICLCAPREKILDLRPKSVCAGKMTMYVH